MESESGMGVEVEREMLGLCECECAVIGERSERGDETLKWRQDVLEPVEVRREGLVFCVRDVYCNAWLSAGRYECFARSVPGSIIRSV